MLKYAVTFFIYLNFLLPPDDTQIHTLSIWIE